MVIYFADRWGKVLGTAATDLPYNSVILDDTLSDVLSSGVQTFECSLIATPEMRNVAVIGNYVMAYDRPFSIITSRFNTSTNTIELYCEDAGLDLINKVVGQVSATSKKFSEWVIATLGSEAESGWKYNFNVEDSSAMLEYTSESTALERLLDIISNFDAEMYFSYAIDGFEWVTRQINFVKRRGNAEKVHRLYIDKEVKAISKEESVTDLATVWKIYGANNKPLSSLSGYSGVTKEYPANDDRMHSYSVIGAEIICNEAVDNWKSKVDNDGRIVQVKYTEYTKAADAISYALREMEKIVEPVLTCEVELVYLPDDIQCGDYVYVLDAQDETLLYARVLEWSRSETKNRTSATLGDFAEMQSGIVDIDYRSQSISINSITISSSNGVTAENKLITTLSAIIKKNNNIITSAEGLEAGESLQWYKDGVAISGATGFSINVEITSNAKYSCKLEGGE